MSNLHGASHVAVLGGTHIAAGAGSSFTINHGEQPGVISAFKDLSAAAAHTALHDSAARYGAPRCHRNTRAKYLHKLELWMLEKGGDYDGKHLIWLHGGAGAGKSAIIQSTVERCARHAVILGSFFFSRTDSARDCAEALIPTLTFQVARAFPAAMIILESIINRNPLIFQASLHTQAYELLVHPLLYLIEIGAIENTSPLRRVFVIDGLDECSDPQKQKLIINVVASILCEYHLPISFLIASRPEVAIGSAFRGEKRLHQIFASISLDDDHDAKSDIRQFVVDSFLDTIDNHPFRHRIQLPWPDTLSIAKLVWKSSGHFIYAATAMKFIASPDEYPTRALQVVEGLEPSRTESPFAQLDSLYLHILTSAKYSSKVLEILRHCYLTAFSHSVAAVCCIHDVAPEDVELFLFDVQALVSLLPNIKGQMRIIAKHASLEDFFKDEKRAQSIYMAAEDYHASLLERYFRLLDDGPHSPVLATALHYWPGQEYRLVEALTTAIRYSQDTKLLQALIGGHSPHDIWNFCAEFFALDTENSSVIHRALTTRSVCEYMGAIRDSLANHDNTLYLCQFGLYIELILDDLDRFVQRKPQYCMIPALIFSSSPSGLVLARDLLFYFGRRFQIDASYRDHFESLQGNTVGIIDPRSLKAIRCLPQSRLSWSSDLAITMKLILRQLVDLSTGRASGQKFDLHRQWLQQHKPWKRISLGSPKLSSTFSRSPYLCGLYCREFSRGFPCTGSSIKPFVCDLHAQNRRNWMQRKKCVTLMKAVIFYLHKSDCTSEVVKLARRSLPKDALWFPKLMKRARADMDAYVRRWEESLDGLLEMARSLSINDMD